MEKNIAEKKEIHQGKEEDEEDENLLPKDTVEGKLQRKIIAMNDKGENLQTIDIYKHNYTPKKRNSSYVWNDKMFYALEGYVDDENYYNKNFCRLEKKELVNEKTKNIIDYEIYLNPDNGVANKIVSIEYQEDGIEVTEYYYSNSKEINFIFQYQTDNYVSGYATPDKEGNRYLFNKDSLVTWRQITGNKKKNYCIGKKEANRVAKAWSRKTIKRYSQLSKEKKEEFAQCEERMIDAAYNTYKIVMEAEGMARIQGYVYDAAAEKVDEATVELYAKDFETLIYSTTTDEEGRYNIFVPSDGYEYNLRIGKSGCVECKIYVVRISNEQIGAYQDASYLIQESSDSTSVDLKLGDAANDVVS